MPLGGIVELLELIGRLDAQSVEYILLYSFNSRQAHHSITEETDQYIILIIINTLRIDSNLEAVAKHSTAAALSCFHYDDSRWDNLLYSMQ